MTLAEFIEHEVDRIVDDWEAFARTHLPAAQDLASDALRDHAKVLLLDVVADMRSTQSAQQQFKKSRGERAGNAPDLTRTARGHAEQRFAEGFTLNQLVAEYRALRASVVRHWTARIDSAAADVPGDVVRFN